MLDHELKARVFAQELREPTVQFEVRDGRSAFLEERRVELNQRIMNFINNSNSNLRIII